MNPVAVTRNPNGGVDSVYLRVTIALIAVGVVLLIAGAALQKGPLLIVSMLLTALALAPLALFGLSDRTSAPRSSSRYEELDADAILPVLDLLEREELVVLRDHEASHKARPEILSKIDEHLAHGGKSAASNGG